MNLHLAGQVLRLLTYTPSLYFIIASVISYVIDFIIN